MHLVIQGETKIPYLLSRSRRRDKVVDIDGEVFEGRCLLWNEEQLCFVVVERQMVCRNPLVDVGQTLRDSCFYLGFRPGKRTEWVICIAVVGMVMWLNDRTQ